MSDEPKPLGPLINPLWAFQIVKWYGIAQAAYGSMIIYRYLKYGDNTPLFGKWPMPFSTALWTTGSGLCLSWMSWALKQLNAPRTADLTMPIAERMKLATAIIGSITAIILALITALKH